MTYEDWQTSVYNFDFTDEMAKAVERVAREYTATVQRAVETWAEQAGVSPEEVLRAVVPSVSMRADGRMVSISVHAVPRGEAEPGPDPCARCGASVAAHNEWPHGWHVGCDECNDGAIDGAGWNCEGGSDPTEAIERWNERQADERAERGQS